MEQQTISSTLGNCKFEDPSPDVHTSCCILSSPACKSAIPEKKSSGMEEPGMSKWEHGSMRMGTCNSVWENEHGNHREWEHDSMRDWKHGSNADSRCAFLTRESLKEEVIECAVYLSTGVWRLGLQ